MARKKKSTRRSWKEPSKASAAVDLINGRSMMLVSLLYDEVEFPKREGRGTRYAKKFLRDYKEHQPKVRECVERAYEVLEENKRERKDPFDDDLLAQVKQTIVDEMGYAWHGKKRPAAPKKVVEEEELPYEEETEEEEQVAEEDIPDLSVYEPPEDDQPDEPDEPDWEERFSEGEFDLE